MKKLIRQLTGIAACVCMLLCEGTFPITAVAKEASMQIEPRMTYILSYGADLSISNNGVATITGSVTGKAGVTQTSVKVTLQKSVSGTWTNVESWEASSDSRNASVNTTYQVSRGTYRVTMTCSANGESESTTSETKTY